MVLNSGFALVNSSAIITSKNVSCFLSTRLWDYM